ncbi:DUF6402 family protein [Burkholderia pyrrocinia]|uniref:DUF6402 family protein n=1 Tax=Burkholderia pyrrocinia TaxID=60550 RepID=UPI00158C69BD|nr:DUF6402 family protein [Burkholderia pyrrocinia]
MDANKKIPYYKINPFLSKWSLCGGADGCEIVYENELGMSKPPPLPKAPERAAPPVPAPLPDPFTKVINDMHKVATAPARFKAWLHRADPPKPAPAPVQNGDPIPPFDIQEIPSAMRKLNMPVAATLMERWFAGELNYSPNDDAEKAGVNQNGEPYPPSMIDKTDITMKWVLGFQRAKVKYDNLIKDVIYSQPSIKQLGDMLGAHPYGTVVDAEKMYCGDIALIHSTLQFEMASVDGSFEDKANQALNRAIDDRGVPDDLTAALGSFVIYAAIERAYVSDGFATVTEISVYVKDNYTFGTTPDHASQYLGHWSSKGVIVVPATEGATLKNREWASFSVKLGDPKVKGNVYRPVRNRDFRQWQNMHGRGGDFFIYSDRIILNLIRPITVKL